MDSLDQFAREIVPSAMAEARISIDKFINNYNVGDCELIDIRVPSETAVWQLNFGLRIPADQLPERLHELPTNTLLVIACPQSDRSNMARSYLVQKGYLAKYLSGGLLGLMDALKGSAAHKIKLRNEG